MQSIKLNDRRSVTKGELHLLLNLNIALLISKSITLTNFFVYFKLSLSRFYFYVVKHSFMNILSYDLYIYLLYY